MVSSNTNMYNRYWYGQYEGDDIITQNSTEKGIKFFRLVLCYFGAYWTLHCHYQLSPSKWNLLWSTFLLHKASYKDDQNLWNAINLMPLWAKDFGQDEELCIKLEGMKASCFIGNLRFFFFFFFLIFLGLGMHVNATKDCI